MDKDIEYRTTATGRQYGDPEIQFQSERRVFRTTPNPDTITVRMNFTDIEKRILANLIDKQQQVADLLQLTRESNMTIRIWRFEFSILRFPGQLYHALINSRRWKFLDRDRWSGGWLLDFGFCAAPRSFQIKLGIGALHFYFHDTTGLHRQRHARKGWF